MVVSSNKPNALNCITKNLSYYISGLFSSNKKASFRNNGDKNAQ